MLKKPVEKYLNNKIKRIIVFVGLMNIGQMRGVKEAKVLIQQQRYRAEKVEKTF